MGETQTVRFRVYGIVQGVGFRPTVDRHAAVSGIRGSVCNKGPYVEIIAQGDPAEVDRFRTLLKDQPPRRAAILKIDEKHVTDASPYEDFRIVVSEKTVGEIYISPDIAICEECAQELYDPENRRYLHPFINCTCCGPRLTILDALPYDRERTSMKMFPMCRTCSQEYHSSASRRYDAQPVCCNDCGPQVYLLPVKEGGSGGIPALQDLAFKANRQSGSEEYRSRAVRPDSYSKAGAEQPPSGNGLRGRDAITAARREILGGGIVAVKGIGGFHLCCDATNEAAVQKLRMRKRRPAKPFAVMMRDEETVLRECLVNSEQRQILTGHQKPILLLERKKEAGPQSLIAPSVAPGNPRIGVMLPYTPLHMLLFKYDDGMQMPDCLVMTSGNVSGAPICRDDADVMAELSDFCDCILSHDRLIRIRADDTVMDFHRGHPYMIRRSRGYAPLPVLLSDEHFLKYDRSGINTGKCILAIGGELKNTFCISSGNLFYLSPYIGDLEDLRTVRALRETVERMESLLEVTPGAIVCDLHPKYNSTMAAEEMAAEKGIPLIRLQHHYAHVLSCMAENDRTDPVIGVSFDGTGFGEDGTIWGGEILLADGRGFTREYSIFPFLQTGGDSAPRQGWRIAASMIWSLCKRDKDAAKAAEAYFDIIKKLGICDDQNARVQRMMAEKGIQAVTSTSAGRLFDAVSAMLGICTESTYEGEASIELQFAAERYDERCKKEAEGLALDEYPLSSGREIQKEKEVSTGSGVSGPRRLPTDRLFQSLMERRLSGEDVEKLAFVFHAGLAALIVRACEEVSDRTGIRTAALTGGCFQNRLLLSLVEDGLWQKGIEVLIHHLVPPNDGGIALGQALAARLLNI